MYKVLIYLFRRVWKSTFVLETIFYPAKADG